MNRKDKKINKFSILITYQTLGTTNFNGCLQPLRQLLQQTFEFRIQCVQTFGVHLIGARIHTRWPEITTWWREAGTCFHQPIDVMQAFCIVDLLRSNVGWLCEQSRFDNGDNVNDDDERTHCNLFVLRGRVDSSDDQYSTFRFQSSTSVDLVSGCVYTSVSVCVCVGVWVCVCVHVNWVLFVDWLIDWGGFVLGHLVWQSNGVGGIGSGWLVDWIFGRN